MSLQGAGVRHLYDGEMTVCLLKNEPASVFALLNLSLLGGDTGKPSVNSAFSLSKLTSDFVRCFLGSDM